MTSLSSSLTKPWHWPDQKLAKLNMGPSLPAHPAWRPSPRTEMKGAARPRHLQLKSQVTRTAQWLWSRPSPQRACEQGRGDQVHSDAAQLRGLCSSRPGPASYRVHGRLESLTPFSKHQPHPLPEAGLGVCHGQAPRTWLFGETLPNTELKFRTSVTRSQLQSVRKASAIFQSRAPSAGLPRGTFREGASQHASRRSGWWPGPHNRSWVWGGPTGTSCNDRFCSEPETSCGGASGHLSGTERVCG